MRIAVAALRLAILLSLVCSCIAPPAVADAPDRLLPFLLRVEGTKWPMRDEIHPHESRETRTARS